MSVRESEAAILEALLSLRWDIASTLLMMGLLDPSSPIRFVNVPSPLTETVTVSPG